MNKAIKNPFAQLYSHNDYKCFGCSPFNKIGLQMTFIDLGDKIESPQQQFEGFSKILHGGIQATLQDEISSWYLFTKCGTSGMTKSIHIEYLKPVYVTDNEIRITAEKINIEEKLITLKIKLFNAEGTLCSEAEIVYYIFPEAVAKRKHFYPGVEKFYD